MDTNTDEYYYKLLYESFNNDDSNSNNHDGSNVATEEVHTVAKKRRISQEGMKHQSQPHLILETIMTYIIFHY